MLARCISMVDVHDQQHTTMHARRACSQTRCPEHGQRDGMLAPTHSAYNQESFENNHWVQRYTIKDHLTQSIIINHSSSTIDSTAYTQRSFDTGHTFKSHSTSSCHPTTTKPTPSHHPPTTQPPHTHPPPATKVCYLYIHPHLLSLLAFKTTTLWCFWYWLFHASVAVSQYLILPGFAQCIILPFFLTITIRFLLFIKFYCA